VTEERLELTKAYCKMHYGMDTYTLKDPKMIVIHCTEAGSLGTSLACFKPAKIPEEREYLQAFGDLNVGVHYLVSKKGEIYRMMPDNIIGRHTIGFNYTALGIENVGKNNADLTQAQALSNAQLVAWLVSQYPSIEYLIGHYEYTNKNLPHYALYIENVTNYKFTSKVDPGVKFMKELRSILKTQYNIILKD
jgi:N-acetyl-anhydromuramyl-L-alanine amidase AmpD